MCKEVNKDYLESYVLDVICKCVLAPEMVKKRLDDFRKYQKSHDTEYRNRLNSLLTEKRTLEIEKENLLRAVERGIATEEILSRIVKKQSDIERVIVSIEELENNKPKEIDEVEFKKLIRKTKQLIKAKKPEELRRFISFYVSKIEIGKDDIKVVLSFRNIVLLLGGGEESRTPVQKPIRTGISERRHLFTFPYPDAKCQASGFGSSHSVTTAGARRRSRSPLK